jgi:hypothetical protein
VVLTGEHTYVLLAAMPAADKVPIEIFVGFIAPRPMVEYVIDGELDPIYQHAFTLRQKLQRLWLWLVQPDYLPISAIELCRVFAVIQAPARPEACQCRVIEGTP